MPEIISQTLRAPVARAAFGRVDADSRSITGVAVVSKGEALGHGLWLDSAFLDSVVAVGNASPKGLKARFTHPDMFADGLGTYLGRITNLTRDGDVVRGDLALSASASHSPKGDLAAYVLSLAQEDPEAFGLSIVFDRNLEAEMQFSKENQGAEGEFRSPDSDNSNNLEHARLSALYGADIVDEPAANPKGLFSQLTELLSKVPPFKFIIGGNMKTVLDSEAEAPKALEACPECGQEMPEDEEGEAEAESQEGQQESPKAPEEKAAESARIDAIEASIKELKALVESLSKPKAAGTAPVPFSGDPQAMPSKDFMTLAREHAAEKKVDIVKAMAHIAKAYPEIHRRYIGR